MSTTTIDVRMHGRPEITAAYLVRAADATALVDTGPASSLPVVAGALERLGVTRLDWIVLTHIHLDHAGACGALAARYPDARIAVHPRGARHVVDPARLWQGVTAVYGERTEALWGRPQPVDAARVHAIEDGETIAVGDRALRAIATPGHARHHHAWLDEGSGDAFVGDAVGMQVGAHELWRATTPPADFDLELALASIERLRAAAPARLLLGHFGAATAAGEAGAVGAALDAGARELRDWTTAITRLRRQGATGAALEEAVGDWLDDHERAWPAAARAQLDGTSAPAVDVAGVVHWLEAAGGAHGAPTQEGARR